MDLIRSGVRVLAGGARRGNPTLAGMGAALLVVGWMRRRRRPRRALLYSRTLRPGDALGIRWLEPEERHGRPR